VARVAVAAIAVVNPEMALRLLARPPRPASLCGSSAARYHVLPVPPLRIWSWRTGRRPADAVRVASGQTLPSFGMLSQTAGCTDHLCVCVPACVLLRH
jgi:hypothetical protein